MMENIHQASLSSLWWRNSMKYLLTLVSQNHWISDQIDFANCQNLLCRTSDENQMTHNCNSSIVIVSDHINLWESFSFCRKTCLKSPDMWYLLHFSSICSTQFTFISMLQNGGEKKRKQSPQEYMRKKTWCVSP